MLVGRRIQGWALRAWRLAAGYAKDLVRVDARRDPARLHALARQVDAATHSLRSLCPAAIVVGPLIGFVFHDQAITPLLIVGVAIVVGMGAAVLRFAGELRSDDAAHVRRSARLHVAIAAALAIGWSATISSVSINATGAVEMLMACFLVAMICVGGLLYINLPSAFLAFSGILALALFVRMAMNPEMSWIAAPLVLVFLGIAARTVVDQSRQFVRLATTSEALAAAEAERHGREIALAEQRAETERAAAEARHREMIALADNFERSVVAVVDGVADAVMQLERAASSLSAISESAIAAAADAAARAEGTSLAIATVAAATAQLNQATAEISARVADHVAVSDKAQSLAGDSELAISRLSEEAARIGGIIALIENVTAQTNLLALNATIEASRAGEAGRGFAVVAAEVKSLANQARGATQQVAEQVSGIHGQVDAAVDRIHRASDEIDGVAAIATTIAASIVQQRDAVGEIGRGASAAAETADDVRRRMAGLSDSARQSGSLTRGVSDTASALARQSDDLRKATSAFLAKLRAA